MSKKNNKAYLSETHIIKNKEWIKILDNECYKAKNLYNAVMYIYKQCNAYKRGKEHESVINQIDDLNKGIEIYNQKTKGKKINKITREKWEPNKYFIIWYMNHMYDPKEYEHPYKALNSNTATRVIDLVFQDWASFLAEINDWKKNPHKYKARPRPPRYKHKTKGRVEIRTRDKAVKKGGWVELYRGCPIKVKTNLPIKKLNKYKQDQIKIIMKLL